LACTKSNEFTKLRRRKTISEFWLIDCGPRGLSKEKARVDLWLKEIAPSNELRKWFGHDPERYNGFKNKYLDELKDKEELIKQLRSIEKIHHTITLLYSAKDEEHNNAVVLLELLKKTREKL